MRMEKIAGAVAVIALFAVVVGFEFKSTVPAVTGSAPEPDLSMPPKCNSPELLTKLNEIFKAGQTKNIPLLQEEVRQGKHSQALLDATIHSVLTIVDTTTLGMDGTLTNCTMDYNYGLPDTAHTWHYQIGRHDSGEMYWKGSLMDAEPYKMWFWQ